MNAPTADQGIEGGSVSCGPAALDKKAGPGKSEFRRNPGLIFGEKTGDATPGLIFCFFL